MGVKYLVKTSQYFDSVSLMNIARDVRALAGVEDAALVMGTDANKGLLRQVVSALSPEALAAAPTDLILMVGNDLIRTAATSAWTAVSRWAMLASASTDVLVSPLSPHFPVGNYSGVFPMSV